MSTPTTSLPLSEFRSVVIEWVEDADPSSHIIHESQVETFVEATLRLHYDPGVNPHNGAACSVARRITATPFEAGGPYWWSTPSLRSNGDRAGTVIFDPMVRQTVWIHPDEAAAEALDEAEIPD